MKPLNCYLVRLTGEVGTFPSVNDDGREVFSDGSHTVELSARVHVEARNQREAREEALSFLMGDVQRTTTSRDPILSLPDGDAVEFHVIDIVRFRSVERARRRERAKRGGR